MTLRVYTARVSYGGDDRLDITRKSAGAEGLPFAPSRAILNPALDLMHNATALIFFADVAPGVEGGAEAKKLGAVVLRATWALYREAYTLEMRESYRAQRAAWDALLARAEVTLCCYCTDPKRCHRTVLARDVLPRLGAEFMGER